MMPAACGCDLDFIRPLTVNSYTRMEGGGILRPGAYTDLLKLSTDMEACKRKLEIAGVDYSALRASYTPSKPPKYLKNKGRWARAEDPGSPEHYAHLLQSWDTSRVR